MPPKKTEPIEEVKVAEPEVSHVVFDGNGWTQTVHPDGSWALVPATFAGETVSGTVKDEIKP